MRNIGIPKKRKIKKENTRREGQQTFYTLKSTSVDTNAPQEPLEMSYVT